MHVYRCILVVLLLAASVLFSASVLVELFPGGVVFVHTGDTVRVSEGETIHGTDGEVLEQTGEGSSELAVKKPGVGRVIMDGGSGTVFASGSLAFILHKQRALLAWAGDTVRIPAGERVSSIEGTIVQPVNAAPGSFRISGNGVAVIKTEQGSYTVLGMAAAGEEASRPRDSLYLNTEELIADPASFSGRLYLLEGQLLDEAPEGMSASGGNSGAFLQTWDSTLVRVSNMENSVEYQTTVLLLVEVQGDTEWRIFAHRIVPSIIAGPMAWRMELKNGRLSLSHSDSASCTVYPGDLVYVHLPQSRRMQTRAEFEGGILAPAFRPSERGLLSGQSLLMRAMSPGEAVIRIYSQPAGFAMPDESMEVSSEDYALRVAE